MADQWYSFGQGFLFVYSITDRSTFEAIPGLHQDILRVKDQSYIPCVVASNKVRQTLDLSNLPTYAFTLPTQQRSCAPAHRPERDRLGDFDGRTYHSQCDLGRLRAVGQIEGRDMARRLSAPFIECSAADGVNVDVAFRELIRLVRKNEKVGGSLRTLQMLLVPPVPWITMLGQRKGSHELV